MCLISNSFIFSHMMRSVIMGLERAKKKLLNEINVLIKKLLDVFITNKNVKCLKNRKKKLKTYL